MAINYNDPDSPIDREADGYAGKREANDQRIVRIVKPVAVVDNTPSAIDATIVVPRFYNRFNFATLSGASAGVNFVVGVSSCNKGEGKTLVAANLAVSLAAVHGKETVLVDLNVRNPSLHAVFGVSPTPGLLESLQEPKISVQRTTIPHLFVLPIGDASAGLGPLTSPPHHARTRDAGVDVFGLENLVEFRNIVYSLREEFDFVVLDMPAIRDPGVPLLLTHQMDGVLVVVDTNRTKKADIDRMFRSVHQSRILAFVFNRSEDILLD